MNAFKTALASTILTASVAFSGAASAQTPAVSNQACEALGKSKGVFEYPASGKGFQEQGNLGCVFGYGASGKFIPLTPYNLSDPRQAQLYVQEVKSANQMENRAAGQAQRQAEADARHAEAQARHNSPDRVFQERVNQLNSINHTYNQLKHILGR